jgi:protein-disulfide isomerase
VTPRHKTALAASIIGILLVTGLGPLSAGGQETDQELREEIEALKKGQEQIRKDLQQIKQLLQAQRRPSAPAAPAGPDVKGKVFDIGDNPVRGADSAKLTLVEFTDYQ